MAEIVNNTLHPFTFHFKDGENSLEWKIHPQDSEEIPNKIWVQIKKNKRVQKMILDKEIHVLNEPVSLVKKLISFFY